MIKNGTGKTIKYDANEVYVDNISIVDYINNKLNKIEDDITRYATYSLGGIGYDQSMNLTTDYQPIDNGSWFGSTAAFKYSKYNVEYIGTTPRSSDETFTKIDFSCTIRYSNFSTGDKLWGKIKIEGKDGSTRRETFVSATIPNTSGDTILVTNLNYPLVKGDKITFELALDKNATVTVLKPHWSITYQQSIDKDYYKFKI